MMKGKIFVRLRSATTGEEFAPPELRARIVAEVEEKGSNIVAVVVSRLARRYGVEYEPKARRAHPSPDQSELDLKVPLDLEEAIIVAAARNGRNKQDEVLWALCQDYGLEFAPTQKRHGPKRLPAAA